MEDRMFTRSWNLSIGFVALALLAVLPPAVLADEQVRLEATLEGTEVEPGAFGRARFEMENERTRFEVRIEGIFDVDTIFVTAGQHFLGVIEMDRVQGRGELRLDTDDGDEIPTLRAGEFVGLFSEEIVLLAFGQLLER